MSEKLPFSQLLLLAWRASFSQKLPWIFGSLLAIASIIESRWSSTLPQVDSFPELMNILSEKSPQVLFSFLLIFIVLFIFEIFSKSNLIASLSFVTGKADLPNHPNTFRTIGGNFFRAFLLECLSLLFLSVVISILSLPYLIAASKNPGAMNTLFDLGFLAFIPIALAVFFIKQFALFYFLLSPLKLRASLEASGTLFSHFIFRSLFFGLFLLILTSLFTFFINIVILSLVALSEKIGFPQGSFPITLIVGFVFFAWFSIFQQALWLAFFKDIAGPKETEETIKEKEVVFNNQTLPEIPPAQ